MKNKVLEEIIIALSLSNLLFIRSWRKILYPNSDSYHIKLEPYSLDFLGVLISVVLLAAVLFGGLQLSRYINSGKTPIVIKLLFLGGFLVVLNGIRLQFFESTLNLYLKLGVFIFVSSVIFLIVVKWRTQIFSFTKTIFLILSPFIFITFSQAIWGVLTANPQPEPNISNQLSTLPQKPQSMFKNRVVWIIFDELDYFVPFESNPRLVDLPEFTRLQNESLFATKAISPAYTTLESIPSLLTGKQVEKGKPLGKDDLILQFKDASAAKFSESSNVFEKIKGFGGQTAIVGWYHSYCRVIGEDLSVCQWESFDTVNDFEQQPFAGIILNNFANCLISFPFGFRLFQIFDNKIRSYSTDSGYLKRHLRMMDATHKVVANRNLDLMLIHLPFPHPPSYYNQQTGEFGSQTNYLDNLALTDKTLGKMRKTLEDSNLWDNSTIIISSDHQWRLNSYKDWLPREDFAITQGIEHPNIPFILKLKDQKEPAIYDKPFNTVITHDLILAIMKGEVSKVNEVKEWLDQNSER